MKQAHETCGGWVHVLFNVTNVICPGLGKGPDSRIFGLHIQPMVLSLCGGRETVTCCIFSASKTETLVVFQKNRQESQSAAATTPTFLFKPIPLFSAIKGGWRQGEAFWEIETIKPGGWNVISFIISLVSF